MSYPDQPPAARGDEGGERPLDPEPDADDLVDAPDILSGNGERPLDPDLDDDMIDSAEADQRAATDGTLDGEVDDQT